jgi:hypothetical protein
MPEEIETSGEGLRISQLPHYRGGFAQAVEDNAMMPLAIGEASNAKTGANEIAVYINQLVSSLLSGKTNFEGYGVQRLKDLAKNSADKDFLYRWNEIGDTEPQEPPEPPEPPQNEGMILMMDNGKILTMDNGKILTVG